MASRAHELLIKVYFIKTILTQYLVSGLEPIAHACGDASMKECLPVIEARAQWNVEMKARSGV